MRKVLPPPIPLPLGRGLPGNKVKTLDGVEIARRELAHPHETEQPFTRSLRGIAMPQGIDKVIVEAHDSVHEYGGRTMTVEVT